ncbi:MAG TPA: hypothetical protein PKN85_10520 [Syntrophorhabdaceae bacterium]|nr:hypothetical protein [Syntrophorhabdaceae bacterium]HOD75907.1 hypothetical protein [Syntrophorhabdaceae bacterium]
MLRARPGSWFSWKFNILDENDQIIAGIDIRWMREAGELHLGGRSYRLFREGLFGGAFILEEDGMELARAEKPSSLFRSFTVTAKGRAYRLHAASPVGRTFILSENDRTIGVIRPENAFTRKAVIDLPEEIALPVKIFMAWLVFVLWKRDEESSS